MSEPSFDIGYSFDVRARWRFLNLLRLPFGESSENAQIRRCEKAWESSGGNRSLRESLSFTKITDWNAVERRKLDGAQEVLTSLADNVFPIAEPALLEVREDGLPAVLAWTYYRPTHDGFRPLHGVISRWASSWGFDDPWYLDVALHTLGLWSRDSDALRARIWEVPSVDLVELPPEERLLIPRWSPVSGESVADFKKRRNDDLGRMIETQDAELKRIEDRQGWPGGTRGFEPKTYAWVVRHHILREKMGSIATWAGVQRGRVKEAVERLSSVLSLRARID